MPAKQTVRLKAPSGTDEANHGTERYRVDNDGTIEVPVEASGPLETVGGFTEVVEPAQPASGLVRVVHDDESASCSFAGETFEKKKDGSFLVPVCAVADLAAHGFVAVEKE